VSYRHCVLIVALQTDKWVKSGDILCSEKTGGGRKVNTFPRELLRSAAIEPAWVYKSQSTPRYKSKQKENSINTFKETYAALVLSHRDETTNSFCVVVARN
jgi:hypothetical protein